MADLQMIHLLIVDDEPHLLDLAKTYLEKTGDFTIDTAASAREAIEMMETGEEGKGACFEITVPPGVWRTGKKQ